MDDLRGHPQCTDFFRAFIDYIKRDILIIDASSRATSRHITKKLEDMYWRCQTSSDYCCKTSSTESTAVDTNKTKKRGQTGSKKRRRSADLEIATNGGSDMVMRRLGLRRSARLSTPEKSSMAMKKRPRRAYS